MYAYDILQYTGTVSYTHLDVYKRQDLSCSYFYFHPIEEWPSYNELPILKKLCLHKETESVGTDWGIRFFDTSFSIFILEA